MADEQTAVILARGCVGNIDQPESLWAYEQVAMCKALCKKRGWKVVRAYNDGVRGCRLRHLRLAVDKAIKHNAHLVMLDDADLFKGGWKARHIEMDFEAAGLKVVVVDRKKCRLVRRAGE